MATNDAATILEQVKGVGPGTRTAVLDEFPSVDALASASIEQLTEIKGVGPATAAAIKEAVSGARLTGKPTKTASSVGTADERSAKIAESAADVADEVEAEVVQLRNARDEIGDRADVTIAQLKGVVTSLQHIVTAALDAGKEQWPATERQLKAALTSLRKTGATLVEAARDLRKTS